MISRTTVLPLQDPPTIWEGKQQIVHNFHASRGSYSTLDVFLGYSTSQTYQEKRISLKLSRLCLTINNDRIWLLWNNSRNSLKMHAGFFKISDYHTSGRFKPSAKLMIRRVLHVGVILVDFLGYK